MTSLLEAREYTVAPNDTLSKIASTQLGLTSRWKEIATLNGLKPPYSIRVGQQLILPDDNASPRGSGDVDVEALQREYDANMRNLGVQLQTSESESDAFAPDRVWIWGLAALLAFWMLCAMCLRVGCWFSLVEATFIRCMFLALIYAVLQMSVVAVVSLVFSWTFDKDISSVAWMILMCLLVFLSLVLAAIVTKRVLGCKWRSVVTVSVMANLVADLLVFGVMLAFGAIHFESIKQLFAMLTMSHGN
ncbi:MAG: LysM peptidoglycan-binding domain-containing protein [bacterium]|nr:LysM peptidoglycan-binding domain-containing protein [bacterium]